jgi:hypothetical protein
MVLHSASKKDKSKEGVKSPIDPARSEERSWIHRRTADLVLAEYPVGNFPDEAWSRLYKMAKGDWAEKEDQ